MSTWSAYKIRDGNVFLENRNGVLMLALERSSGPEAINIAVFPSKCVDRLSTIVESFQNSLPNIYIYIFFFHFFSFLQLQAAITGHSNLFSHCVCNIRYLLTENITLFFKSTEARNIQSLSLPWQVYQPPLITVCHDEAYIQYTE